MTYPDPLRHVGTIALILGALWSTACQGADIQEGGPGQATALDRVADTLCDTEGFRDMADSIVGALRATYDTVPPPDSVLTLVSEPYLHHGAAHDCQRLLTPGMQQGDRMDTLPLVALFVSTNRVQSGNFGQGVVVSDIVNYGPGEYVPLGIPQGLSCLWIQGSSPGEWTAEIRVPTAADGNCVNGELQSRSGVQLEVNRLQIETPPRVYPSTGRWMRDSVAVPQFIGIRCGNGWCEIGAVGFQGTHAVPTSADVPGLWDEQLLAHPQLGQPLTLSGLVGRIVPGVDNRAAMANVPGDSAGPPSDSLHVATMYFSGADSAAWETYVAKFALDPPDMTIGHKVYMHCDPNPPRQCRLRSQNGVWTDARRSADPHAGLGTVRWAWSERDEGLWVPCDAGCCMSTGLEGP